MKNQLVAGDPAISLELREKIRRRRKELGMSLSNVVLKSTKTVGKRPFSISTLSAIERGDMLRMRSEKMEILFATLGLELDNQRSRISLGVSTELDSRSKSMMTEFFSYFTVYNLKLSRHSNQDLLNGLRNGSMHIAVLGVDDIDGRLLEFTRVVKIAPKICLIVLTDEKEWMRSNPEYRTFFREAAAAVNFVCKKNSLFEFMFYPEWVL